MEKHQLLNASTLDIIFDGKQTAYGAYDLRKSYNSRITKSILIMLLACAAIFIYAAMSSYIQKHKAKVVTVNLDQALTNVAQAKKPPPPPPPPPPKPKPPKIKITKFVPPKIVEKADTANILTEITKLEHTKIGTINVAGADIDNNTVAPPIEGGDGGVFSKSKDDQIYTTVEILADFPGGKKAWSRYLERNLNNDLPSENGAPAGNYTVVVSFIVNKEGKISDVKAESGPTPDYGTKEESVRVIEKGPNWMPAEQNGRKVIYRARQTITFQVAVQQ